jgi:flagellar biosynthesis/type III secretory pathway protein FliH
MKNSCDRQDLQVLIDVLLSVLRRRRASAAMHTLHVNPHDLHRYDELVDRFYGIDGHTLEDFVGLPVQADPQLAVGELQLRP